MAPNKNMFVSNFCRSSNKSTRIMKLPAAEVAQPTPGGEKKLRLTLICHLVCTDFENPLPLWCTVDLDRNFSDLIICLTENTRQSKEKTPSWALCTPHCQSAHATHRWQTRFALQSEALAS